MKKKKKSKKKIGAFFLFLIILIVCVCAIMLIDKQMNKKEVASSNEIEEEEPVKKVQIVDEDSDSRNIAVMYNNISTVWGYQSGLQDAYIVYEMIVEGGYTRLMAIFKDATTERIGSVRSSRPYYLDYVLENDAIYVHYGASQQALSDIQSLGVNNINGMYYEASFWRDKTLNLATEHTAFTSMELIQKGIEKYQYRTTTTQKLLLNYSADEVDLSTLDGAIEANKVYIDYSSARSTTFEYDSVNRVYLRSQGTAKGNYAHEDAITGKQYTAKNIITYQVENYTIDSYGRQALNTVGGGTGYYITDGYAIPIIWEKTSRSAQTTYKYLNGTEIDVNDGNTYIEIQPVNRTLTIE